MSHFSQLSGQYFLRKQSWKCIFWESSFENLFFEGAIFKKAFFKRVISKTCFLREQFQIKRAISKIYVLKKQSFKRKKLKIGFVRE